MEDETDTPPDTAPPTCRPYGRRLIMVGLLLSVPVLLLSVYLGAYYAMLEPDSFLVIDTPWPVPKYQFSWSRQGNPATEKLADDELATLKPIYRVDERWVEILFRPAFRIDRMFRFDHWYMTRAEFDSARATP